MKLTSHLVLLIREYVISQTHCIRNADDRSDVQQDIVIEVFRNFDKFDPERATLKAWTQGIARNMVRKYMKDHYRFGVPGELDENVVAATDDLVQVEAKIMLLQALHGLSPEHQQVIVMVELMDMAYDEAAVALRIPVGTVKSRLSAAKSRIAEILLNF